MFKSGHSWQGGEVDDGDGDDDDDDGDDDDDDGSDNEDEEGDDVPPTARCLSCVCGRWRGGTVPRYQHVLNSE